MVVLDRNSSEDVFIKSGVPQGNVLGPPMFLLYINDISDNINSKIRLFSDHSFLYGFIDNPNDTLALKHDLDILVAWVNRWQMIFNAPKCYILRIHKKQNINPVIYP